MFNACYFTSDTGISRYHGIKKKNKVTEDHGNSCFFSANPKYTICKSSCWGIELGTRVPSIGIIIHTMSKNGPMDEHEKIAEKGSMFWTVTGQDGSKNPLYFHHGLSVRSRQSPDALSNSMGKWLTVAGWQMAQQTSSHPLGAGSKGWSIILRGILGNLKG